MSVHHAKTAAIPQEYCNPNDRPRPMNLAILHEPDNPYLRGWRLHGWSSARNEASIHLRMDAVKRPLELGDRPKALRGPGARGATSGARSEFAPTVAGRARSAGRHAPAQRCRDDAPLAAGDHAEA
jgi:hypothetical protein